VNEDLPVDAATQQLVDLYERAGRRLRIMARTFAIRGATGSQAHAEQQLKLVESILARLKIERARIVPVVAARAWAMGAGTADAAIGRPDIAFGGIHEDAVARIARALTEQLGQAERECGRRSRDLYRQRTLERVAEKEITGGTRRAASSALVRDLVQDGLTGFVDRAGRRWQLDVYARMAVRTTGAEAVSQATGARLVEAGRPDVQVSDHQTKTPLCDQFEGHVYSLIKGGRYPFLKVLPPFHPNCKHVITPARTQLADFRRQMARAATWEELEAQLTGAARRAA
jgi:hypothetical protein